MTLKDVLKTLVQFVEKHPTKCMKVADDVVAA